MPKSLNNITQFFKNYQKTLKNSIQKGKAMLLNYAGFMKLYILTSTNLYTEIFFKISLITLILVFSFSGNF